MEKLNLENTLIWGPLPEEEKDYELHLRLKERAEKEGKLFKKVCCRDTSQILGRFLEIGVSEHELTGLIQYFSHMNTPITELRFWYDREARRYDWEKAALDLAAIESNFDDKEVGLLFREIVLNELEANAIDYKELPLFINLKKKYLD